MPLFLFQLTKGENKTFRAAVIAESKIIAKSKLESEIRQASFKIPKDQHEKGKLLYEISPEHVEGVFIIPTGF